jgi:hypothetical protein
MSDPLTIGEFVVAVLAKAAEEGIGEAAKSAVKVAYDKLKGKVSHWAGSKVATLEAAPESEKTRRDVAEIIDRQTEQELIALRILAQTLINEVENSGLAVGVEFLDLKNVEVSLENITAKDRSVGARVERMEGGKIKAKGVKAGGSSVK